MKNWSIIFDLDGTLIDTVPDVCGALNRTLTKYGRHPHTVDEVKDYMGRGARVTRERALGLTGNVPSDEMIDRLTAEFLADYAKNPIVDSTLYPYVLDALSQLRASGASLAVCTNKPSVTAYPVLAAFDIDKVFDAIICGDEAVDCKPNGNHILETIAKAGGNPSKSIMVGDSENDIDAAIDAGVPSVLVTFGYPHAPHQELGASIIIDHYEDLIGSVATLIAASETI